MKVLLAIIISLVLKLAAFAHPTGNMIVVGDHVLWPYVCPLDDPGHHACIMIWSEGNDPKLFLKSEYTASDFMLYNHDEEIYIIERRYDQSTQKNNHRILKSSELGSQTVIWPWFEHELRIGEGGFFMLSDDEIVFVSYPDIYRLKRGEEPKLFFEFDEPLKRLRDVSNDQLLVLGDGKAWLTDHGGEVIQSWGQLPLDTVQDPPLNRNQIFDIDYQNGELLFANWGNRSFDVIGSEGKRRTVLDLDAPLTPHWVAHFGSRKLLFASRLVLDGGNPKPHLLMETQDHEIMEIWTKENNGLSTGNTW